MTLKYTPIEVVEQVELEKMVYAFRLIVFCLA